MTLYEILSKISVDCKDNQRHFTVKNRILAIQELLANTSYELLQEGYLCYIYGKKDVRNSEVILVSSHIDCVFEKVFCTEKDADHYLGTFDNSITNACVLYDMINDTLPCNVVIAFTGDEEEDSGGAQEVVRVLNRWHCRIKMAIVLDVTEEGWEEGYPFTVENDLGIDIVTGYNIIKSLEPYNDQYKLVHDAEPDESWDYDEAEIPCFTLCLPIYGDMHGEEGVLARKTSLPVYCEVLSKLASL